MAGSQIVQGILLFLPQVLGAIFWLFFCGSREENAVALGRQLESHVSVTFMQQMNNKYLPEVLYLEQSMKCVDVAVAEERSGFYGLNSSWVTNI